MAKQTVRTTTTKSYVKKSQVVTDRQGKKHCDDETMKQKYMMVSDTLFQLFMTEHNNLGKMFKEE